MTWALALFMLLAVAVALLPLFLALDAARRPLDVLAEAEEREQFRDMYARIDLEAEEPGAEERDDPRLGWRRLPGPRRGAAA